MKKSIILISFFLFLFACRKENRQDSVIQQTWNKKVNNHKDMFDVFSKEIPVKTEVFLKDSVNYGYIVYLNVLKNHLILYNLEYKRYFTSVFDLKSKKFEKKFLANGKGPNEFLYPFIFKYKNDSLIIADMDKQKMYFIKESDIDKNFIDFEKNSIVPKPLNKGDRIIRIFPFYNYFICSGLYKEKAFSVFNHSGNFITNFGELPKLIGLKVNNEQASYRYAYHYLFAYNKTKNILAAATNDDFKFYSYNKKTKTFKNIFAVQWNFQEIADKGYTKNGKPFSAAWTTDKCGEGSGGMAASGKYIYFSFSEYSYKETSKEDIENYYGYIFVMDWSGNPVCRLKLDKPVAQGFDIDSGQQYIYYTHTDTESGISEVIRLNIKNVEKMINTEISK